MQHGISIRTVSARWPRDGCRVSVSFGGHLASVPAGRLELPA